MNITPKELLHSLVMAALAILIMVSLIWWVTGLAHGVFATGPFISLLAGITVAGILDKEENK